MTPDLQHLLGYTFREPHWLVQALTHSTYANEHKDAGPDNERLEFLGDAVLGVLAARVLIDRHPDAGEGELSRRRAHVVRREALAEQAKALTLEAHLRVGAGQARAGVEGSQRLLSDAYEALAGAVFMDGGFEAAQKIFAPRLDEALAEVTDARDFKTELQECSHAAGLGTPRYRVLSATGPDHQKHYVCHVEVDGRVLGTGEGSSKKIAEQTCAKEALAAMGRTP